MTRCGVAAFWLLVVGWQRVLVILILGVFLFLFLFVVYLYNIYDYYSIIIDVRFRILDTSESERGFFWLLFNVIQMEIVACVGAWSSQPPAGGGG